MQLKYLVPDIPIEPNAHQMRVSKSLAKLNVPDWYKDHTQGPTRREWRPKDRTSKPGSWRRRTSGTQSAVVTRPTTPDNVNSTANPLHTSQTISNTRSVYQNRWSCSFALLGPLPNNTDKENSEPVVPQPMGDDKKAKTSVLKSTNSYLSYRQPYMGWRSQERLKLSSSYLHPPTQRLASSLLNPPNLSRIAE